MRSTRQGVRREAHAMTETKHQAAGHLGFLMNIFPTWLWRTEIEVFNSCPPSVASATRRMLDGTIDTPFKCKANQFVYRLDTPAGIYYLKRTSHQSPRSILRNLLRGRLAHTASGWEYLAIRALEEHDLSVMKPVAWGEERLLGIWPRRGFLLVEEVAGRDVGDILLGGANAELRCEAFGALGHYLGRLHGNGLFHPARPHDFFMVRGDDSGAMQLTMIDIDFRGLSPIPRPFEQTASIDALSQSCYLFYRVGHRAVQVEARRFLVGYRAGLRDCGQYLKPGFLRELVATIDRRLAEHIADPVKMEKFPDVASSVLE